VDTDDLFPKRRKYVSIGSAKKVNVLVLHIKPFALSLSKGSLTELNIAEHV